MTQNRTTEALSMCKFSNQKRKPSLFATWWVFWHECRLLRLLLLCASIQQGGKAQIFKHEEQSYVVAVGFKSITTGCFIISPFLLGKNFLLKGVFNRTHLFPQHSKKTIQMLSTLLTRHSFNERGRMAGHRRADLGLGQSKWKTERKMKIISAFSCFCKAANGNWIIKGQFNLKFLCYFVYLF